MNHPATYFEQPHKYNKKVRSNALVAGLGFIQMFLIFFFLFASTYTISILKIRQVKGEEEIGVTDVI